MESEKSFELNQLKFPIINTSDEFFEKEHQFNVLYSDKLSITVNTFKTYYKNQEFIDADGNCYLLYGANDVPMDFGNFMRLSQIWPLRAARNSAKATTIQEQGLILLFKKLDKKVSLEELKVSLLKKSADYHFVHTVEDEQELVQEIKACTSHEALMNLVVEES